ncbi:MAG: ATP-binding protein [Leptolyngbyaceae cyanobacterium bins.59]|nr:ATP-binding protein [Leptolyngbyaceae cyanobacterium bins.59]
MHGLGIVSAIVLLLSQRSFLQTNQSIQTLTAQHQIEQQNLELQQKNLELERVINQRSQELGQQSQRLDRILTELQRMQVNLIQLEKSSLLGQMIAGISHEISNPVNFIAGNLPHIEDYMEDLVRLLTAYEVALGPDLQRPELQAVAEEIDREFILEDFPLVLHSIRQGTERIRGLIDNLENFYRTDAATGMKFTNLNEILGSVLTLLQNRYKKKIQVIRQFEEIPLVECCPTQLSQVFLNLISNSIEVLLEKSTTLDRQIEVMTRLMGDDRVAVMISDNGAGMPQEVQEHLFEPFYTTKPVGIGTGLGLSIAHYIVTEAHRGRIYCCSALGEGTTFIVELPIHQPNRISSMVTLSHVSLLETEVVN